jgi:hypothetical protein
VARNEGRRHPDQDHDDEDEPFGTGQHERGGDPRQHPEPAGVLLADERQQGPGHEHGDQADLHAARGPPEQRPAQRGEDGRDGAGARGGQRTAQQGHEHDGAGEAHDAEGQRRVEQQARRHDDGGGAEQEDVEQAARPGGGGRAGLVAQEVAEADLAGVLQVDVDVVERGDDASLVVRRVHGQRREGGDDGERADGEERRVETPRVGLDVPVWVIGGPVRARLRGPELRVGHRLAPGHGMSSSSRLPGGDPATVGGRRARPGAGVRGASGATGGRGGGHGA